MKTIPFSNNKTLVCIVDDEYYEELIKYKWHVIHNPNKTLHYAVRSFTTASKSKTNPHRISKSISMHRQLMKPGKRLVVDHIDGNGLNNQRSNLRIVTIRQNLINRHRPQKYKLHGVSQSRNGKWCAHIGIDGYNYNLGKYDTEQDAANAYAEHARIADYVQSLMR